MSKYVLAILLTAGCGAAPRNGMTILAMGTSVTRGSVVAPGSWRIHLSSMLHEAGVHVDFVGTARPPSDPATDDAGLPFDGRCEAYNGATTTSLDAVAQDLPLADYVVIEAGISDMHALALNDASLDPTRAAANAAQVATGLAQLLRDVRGRLPEASILVQEILQVSTTEQPSIDALNAQLPVLCRAVAPCAVVPVAHLLTDADKTDAYHPSVAGSASLARVICATVGQ